MRIYPKGSCACDAHALRMNVEGCDWCEENIDEIVGWMKDEARTHGILFSEFVAAQLVSLAIRRAKIKSSHL